MGSIQRLNVQRPTLNAQSRRQLHSMLDVRRSTFGVFFSPQGRVAESGLRHSTRNRAWGNPPWVRIPPLPPVCFAVHPFQTKTKLSGVLAKISVASHLFITSLT